MMKPLRPRFYYVLAFYLLTLFWIFPVRSAGQAQQPTLVIEGGTLIDGNGGTPVRDALILMQGNRITNVSRKGQVSYPAGARVIRADGKFILPGLWDARVNHAWFVNEALLNHGVTSLIDMATNGEIAIVNRDAVERGKIVGPRMFTGIGFIASRPGARGSGFETPLTAARVPKSAEEARELAKRFIDAKANMVVIQDGDLALEHYRAIVEEAQKAGAPVYARPAGPKVWPKDAVQAGINVLTHSGDGLGMAVTKDPSKWNNEMDAWSDVDPAKTAELVQLIVQRKVTLEPNFVEVVYGLNEKWAHFEEEDRKIFSNRALRVYFPQEAMDGVLRKYEQAAGLDAGVRERRYVGMMNALRFHNQVVKAGGRVLIGSDGPSNSAPGIGFHHEVELLAAGGLAPMEIIQAATKWAAEAANASSRLGTLEVGKIADVVILSDDPLQDVRNLKKVDSVILDGKLVDRGYRAWYQTPFLGTTGANNPVEDLNWVVALKQATARGGGGRADAPDPENLTPPGIETISPLIVTEGSPPLTLTIKGFNFFNRSQVYFDNLPVPFRRVSGTELQVTIDESLLRRAGRFNIQVKNPPPLANPEWSNGTSNTAHLLVNYK